MPPSPPPTRPQPGTALSLALMILAGCEAGIRTDYSSLNLVDVSGVVTLDGEPLADALVVFESEDLTLSSARTDADGAYSLQFNSEQSGVTPGPKTVRISTTGSLDEEAGAGEDGEGGDPDQATVASESEAVPACYNTESRLRVDVRSDTRQFDFALQSDCSTTGPQ